MNLLRMFQVYDCRLQFIPADVFFNWPSTLQTFLLHGMLGLVLLKTPCVMRTAWRLVSCRLMFILRKGRELLKTRSVRLGRPKVHSIFCAWASADADGSVVHMYRDSSVAPILNQRRKLKNVLDDMQGMRVKESSLSQVVTDRGDNSVKFLE